MSVEALSDSELRTKLAEYGYPVGPVTLTTRKILMKKLKNLIETKGGSGSRHSLAARYSSDETDEDIKVPTPSVTKKKKATTPSSRRQTLANPMPPPLTTPSSFQDSSSQILRNQSKTSRAASKEPETHKNVPTLSSSPTSDYERLRSTKTTTIEKKYVETYDSKNSKDMDDLETGSDSDLAEEPERSVFSTYTRKSKVDPPSTSKFSHLSKNDSKLNEAPYKPSVPLLQSQHTSKTSTSLGSTGTSTLDRNDREGQKESRNDPLANYDSPFLSEFTRRLSSRTTLLDSLSTPRTNLSSSAPRQTITSTSENKEKDTNGSFHFPSLRSSYFSPNSGSRYVSPSATTDGRAARDIVTGRTMKTFSRDAKEEAKSNQNMISIILLVVLALFFGILAIIYMGLGGRSDNFPFLTGDNSVPLCSSDISKPGVNCIQKENVESVLQLLKRVQPILTEKAVAQVCDNSQQPSYLTDEDIVNLDTKMKESSTARDVRNDLHSAQLLIFKNPKWGISLVEVDDENTGTMRVLDTMEKVFHSRFNGKVGMAILNPELPLQCLLKNKLFTLFSTLVLIAIGVFMLFAIHKFLLWYLRYKKSAEREVFQLVSEIISTVEAHHQSSMVATPGGTQESFLAINHVRDNLIPPKDRKKMAGIWEKAVKFLDENESRIRREIQQVAGEEFHVWRWLPNNTLNASMNSQNVAANKKSKVWQGQAFETMEGSVNSLACSPTPCLKIRHMFDPDTEFEEDWETKVQDAILEKCGDGVKILHIQVDRGSHEGCVYIKCMSQEDAGKAYRALHGCWFDGHLVTVKYLRLERYHERFPDSINCTTPLKPSNNQRLSMQAHYWQSPFEAN